MVMECESILVALNVPQLHQLVLTTRNRKPAVRTELGILNPVTVATKRAEKAARRQRPNLHELVIGCGDQKFAVVRESYGAYRPCVSLHNHRLSLPTVIK
jgi:hypothetical protein